MNYCIVMFDICFDIDQSLDVTISCAYASKLYRDTVTHAHIHFSSFIIPSSHPICKSPNWSCLVHCRLLINLH